MRGYRAAGGGALFTDNFNRADGVINSGWTTHPSSTGTWMISSNQAQERTQDNPINYPTTFPLIGTQECTMTFNQFVDGDGVNGRSQRGGLAVLLNASAPVNGYFFMWQATTAIGGANTAWNIFRYDNGVQTVLASGSVFHAQQFPNGTVFRMRAEVGGSITRVFVQANGVTIPGFDINDNSGSRKTIGRVGIGSSILSTGVNNSSLWDNFSGGTGGAGAKHLQGAGYL